MLIVKASIAVSAIMRLLGSTHTKTPCLIFIHSLNNEKNRTNLEYGSSHEGWNSSTSHNLAVEQGTGLRKGKVGEEGINYPDQGTKSEYCGNEPRDVPIRVLPDHPKDASTYFS